MQKYKTIKIQKYYKTKIQKYKNTKIQKVFSNNLFLFLVGMAIFSMPPMFPNWFFQLILSVVHCPPQNSTDFFLTEMDLFDTNLKIQETQI